MMPRQLRLYEDALSVPKRKGKLTVAGAVVTSDNLYRSLNKSEIRCGTSNNFQCITTPCNELL
jgi:hypothetical protein